MATVKPAEVRAAREFLRKRGIKGVSPRKFATSSVELGIDYRELLAFITGIASGNDTNTSVQQGSPSAA